MMNDAIVVIAAMPGEIAALVRSWAALESRDGVDGWQHPNAPIMAFAGGMGAGAATRSFARACQVCEPLRMFSVGWAGALLEEQRAGDVLRPRAVRDVNTGETFDMGVPGNCMQLLTAARVATRDEKYRLAASYPGAAAVDMEAATLARVALGNGIDFRVLKAISDTLDEDLPDLNPYVTERGKFATARFIAHIATRPRYWSTLSQFGRQAKLAAVNLCDAICDDIGIERPT